jgi:hypothetical protein
LTITEHRDEKKDRFIVGYPQWKFWKTWRPKGKTLNFEQETKEKAQIPNTTKS